MKRYFDKIVYKALLASCFLVVVSCKRILDVDPKNQVDITNHYRNVYDANAAVIGIYGQFAALADRYIVLNEMRADLVTPTQNADRYLRQLEDHEVTADNPWADPKPFYSIILNINDAMFNFDKMLAEGKLKSTDYQQRYSDLGALRCFLYLQLGIHYGSVPYITDPLAQVSDLKDESKFPKLEFDALLDKLIAFMGDPQRFLDPYPGAASTTGTASTSLSTTVDGYPTTYVFINKSVLLGELYLWKGMYAKAFERYVYAANIAYRTTTPTSNGVYYSTLRVAFYANAILWVLYGSNSPNSNLPDEASLNDGPNAGWRSMFTAPDGGGGIAAQEWIWSVPYDRNFAPTYPLIDLFSPRGGKYLVKASNLILNDWDAQEQRNGIPYDARKVMSVKTLDGQPVIMKPLYSYLNGPNFTAVNPLQKRGRWLIQRGGLNLLHMAECAVNDNQVKIAYALTNVGLTRVFDGFWPANVPNPAPTNTDRQQTFQPAPYNLDARFGGTVAQSDWGWQQGTRDRANLPPLPSSYASDKFAMENAILFEEGLEGAFEGYRWPDLVRFAKRRNDPSILAERVYQKLLRQGNPKAASVRAKLMDPKNWYLPFNL